MRPDSGEAGPAPGREGSRVEFERLRAARRHQAAVIAILSEAVSNFHRGLGALRAENAELRAESRDLPDRLHDGSREDDELVELAIEPGPWAPGIARRAVAEALADRVGEPVLADAQLLTSELVTNSVRHSRMPDADDVIVRLRIWQDRCRLEVEDSGHEGVIGPRKPDPVHGCGMGLNLVQALSERWGLVRAADGPTRVWAQLRFGDRPDRPRRPVLTLVRR